MSTSAQPPADRAARPRWLGAVTGLVAAAVAIGISQLVAAFTGEGGAPVTAVGGLVIDHTPPAVKNFAISAFGSHDKTVLIIGVVVLLAALAAAAGAAAVSRIGYGLAGVGVLAAIGVTAALTRPAAGAADALPTLIGAAAAAYILARLIRMLPAARPAGQRPDIRWAGPDRRSFLVNSSVALGVAAAGYAGASLLPGPGVTAARTSLRLPRPTVPAPPLPPGADLHIPGLASFITPNSSFYRVDTALILPEVQPASWQLRIHGMVEREIRLSFADLLRRPLIENYTTLTCVSNPVAGPYIGNARWLGASLANLVRLARPRAGADQLLCTSADGFTSGTPLAVVLDGRDALLAVAMNGSPLPVAHGFPARMVVPGLYGYVSATKWLTDIKVTTFAAEQAYWVQRGWAQRGPIKTESRIDVPGGQVRAGRTPVAGVAWAQHKGIDAVEVRVDAGPWQRATLAAVPGIDTWRQWAWEWDATAGSHVIEARATDATGYTQTSAFANPEPNGASGYPSVRVSVQR